MLLQNEEIDMLLILIHRTKIKLNVEEEELFERMMQHSFENFIADYLRDLKLRINYQEPPNNWNWLLQE